MLKKFATWFIVFGLSFLVSDVFGWTEQGKAFLYLHFGIDVVIILGLVLISLLDVLVTGATKSNAIHFESLLVTAGILVITLLTTWGATKLFNVNFYVAYQIMTLGKCLYGCNKEE